MDKKSLRIHMLLRIEERNTCARLACLSAADYEPGYRESVRLTGMPRESMPGDPTPMHMMQQDQLTGQLQSLRARITTEEAQIEALLEQISDPDERQIIRLRYFDGHPWLVIADLLRQNHRGMAELESYEKRAYYLHRRALANLKTIQEKIQAPR